MEMSMRVCGSWGRGVDMGLSLREMEIILKDIGLMIRGYIYIKLILLIDRRDRDRTSSP
jgi:hypothetical protein